MLATKVIATGVTHLTDARYFAAWEVDYLTFALGEDGLDWATLNAMREWIAGPEIGVELPSVEGAAGTLGEHALNLLLLPSPAPAAAQKAVSEAGIRLFTRVPVAGYQSAEDIRELVEDVTGTVILDFESGGITWNDLVGGAPFGPSALRELLALRPTYLQIALGAADPKQLAVDFPIAGFAVRGSSEEKVGYKSFDDLDPLFEGLEVFD